LIDDTHPLAPLAELLARRPRGKDVALEELGVPSPGDPEGLGFRRYHASAPGIRIEWCQPGLTKAADEFVLHLCRDASGAWLARMRPDWHGVAMHRNAVKKVTRECLSTLRRIGSVLRVPVAYQSLYMVDEEDVVFEGEAFLCFRFGHGPGDEGVRVARVYLDDDCFLFAWYSEHVQVSLEKALKKGQLELVPGQKRRGRTKLKEWLKLPMDTPERDLKIVPWMRRDERSKGERITQWEIAERRRVRW